MLHSGRHHESFSLKSVAEVNHARTATSESEKIVEKILEVRYIDVLKIKVCEYHFPESTFYYLIMFSSKYWMYFGSKFFVGILSYNWMPRVGSSHCQGIAKSMPVSHEIST